ncbi:hypothetical protein AKJ16_DCAP01047 [Drosera capensis]
MSMAWLSIMSFMLVLMLLEVREIDSIHNYGGTEGGDLQLRGRRALLKWEPEKEKSAKKEFSSRGNSASMECYDGTSESTLQVQQHRSSRMPGAPPAPRAGDIANQWWPREVERRSGISGSFRTLICEKVDIPSQVLAQEEDGSLIKNPKGALRYCMRYWHYKAWITTETIAGHVTSLRFEATLHHSRM